MEPVSSVPSLDHVVVAVSSLAGAVDTFAAAGFTVMPGGRHDVLPTENALVPFPDGSYLELLAVRDTVTRDDWRSLAAGPGWARHLRGVSAIARRFLPSLAGADGVVDWCLRSTDLARAAARLRRLGHVAAGPVAMERERPDGERLAWSLLLPESRLLPFWIADRSPRERRVPAMPAPHANGARGLASVRIRASAVPMAALALGDTLDVVPEADPAGATTLDLGRWRIALLPGEREGPDAVSVRGAAGLPDAVRALGVRDGD
jgi:hypothetical protein